MTTDDYSTGLRDVMELQQQFDEIQNILFEHMEKSSVLTERERQWAEQDTPRNDKGAE